MTGAALGLVLLLAQQAVASAADVPAAVTAPDKSAYTLFNPTPADQLRDFSPDRPTKVLGPNTIDAGHVEIDTDLFNYTWDPRNGRTTTRAFSFPNPEVRIGLTNFWEIGIATSMYNSLKQSGPGVFVDKQGYGDTTILNKFNLFGNDGGDQAFAVIPVVKIPTADAPLGNTHVEYNFFAPFRTNLPSGFVLILQPGLGAFRNSTNTGYVANYSFIANIGHSLFTDALTAYAEVAIAKSGERGIQGTASFDTALQWTITKNFAVDVGINFGLNKVTARYNPYVGLAYRF